MKTRFKCESGKRLWLIGSAVVASTIASGCVFFPGAVGRVHPAFKTDVADAQYSHVGKNLVEGGGQGACVVETESPNAVSFHVSGIQIAVATDDRNQTACQSTTLILPVPYDFRFTPTAMANARASVWVEISGADMPLDASAIAIRADSGETFHPSNIEQCATAGCKARVKFDPPCSIV
jgi:hypothetical protein